MGFDTYVANISVVDYGIRYGIIKQNIFHWLGRLLQDDNNSLCNT